MKKAMNALAVESDIAKHKKDCMMKKGAKMETERNSGKYSWEGRKHEQARSSWGVGAAK